MQAVAPDARVLFMLTTNRPEVLEPALAGRPGRIDQAIEIGLPEDRERRILLARYWRRRRGRWGSCNESDPVLAQLAQIPLLGDTKSTA